MTGLMVLAWGVLVFSSSYIVQGLFIVQFDWVAAARYSAFLPNLLMSGLFLAMFVGRQGSRSQSLVSAGAKWLGTLAPTILFGVYENAPFIRVLGLLCSIFDLAYIGLLLWAKRQPVPLNAPAP